MEETEKYNQEFGVEPDNIETLIHSPRVEKSLHVKVGGLVIITRNLSSVT